MAFEESRAARRFRVGAYGGLRSAGCIFEEAVWEGVGGRSLRVGEAEGLDVGTCVFVYAVATLVASVLRRWTTPRPAFPDAEGVSTGIAMIPQDGLLVTAKGSPLSWAELTIGLEMGVLQEDKDKFGLRWLVMRGPTTGLSRSLVG